MSKCQISKCGNESFKNVETKVVDPNNNGLINTSISLCKEHYDKIMKSSACHQSFSVSSSGDKHGKSS